MSVNDVLWLISSTVIIMENGKEIFRSCDDCGDYPFDIAFLAIKEIKAEIRSGKPVVVIYA